MINVKKRDIHVSMRQICVGFQWEISHLQQLLYAQSRRKQRVIAARRT